MTVLWSWIQILRIMRLRLNNTDYNHCRTWKVPSSVIRDLTSAMKDLSSLLLGFSCTNSCRWLWPALINTYWGHKLIATRFHLQVALTSMEDSSLLLEFSCTNSCRWLWPALNNTHGGHEFLATRVQLQKQLQVALASLNQHTLTT